MEPKAGDKPQSAGRPERVLKKREHVGLYKEGEDQRKLELLPGETKLPSFPLSLAPETGKNTRTADPSTLALREGEIYSLSLWPVGGGSTLKRRCMSTCHIRVLALLNGLAITTRSRYLWARKEDKRVSVLVPQHLGGRVFFTSLYFWSLEQARRYQRGEWVRIGFSQPLEILSGP